MKKRISRVLMLVLIVGICSIGMTETSFAASKTSVGQGKKVKIETRGRNTVAPTYDITWDKVKGVTGYQIYIKIGSGAFQKVKTTSKNKYTHVFDEFNKDYIYGVNKEFDVKIKVRAYKKSKGKMVYGKFSKTDVSDISYSMYLTNYVQMGARALKDNVKYPSTVKIQRIYTGMDPLDESEKNDARYEGLYKYIIYIEYIAKNDYNQDCRGYFKLTIYEKRGKVITGKPLKLEMTNSITDSYLSRSSQKFVDYAQRMINI